MYDGTMTDSQNIVLLKQIKGLNMRSIKDKVDLGVTNLRKKQNAQLKSKHDLQKKGKRMEFSVDKNSVKQNQTSCFLRAFPCLRFLGFNQSSIQKLFLMVELSTDKIS
jgi:hypothetical protein